MKVIWKSSQDLGIAKAVGRKSGRLYVVAYYYQSGNRDTPMELQQNVRPPIFIPAQLPFQNSVQESTDRPFNAWELEAERAHNSARFLHIDTPPLRLSREVIGIL